MCSSPATWAGRGCWTGYGRRIGIGAALRRVAEDRRLDATATERVVFALVAQRALRW